MYTHTNAELASRLKSFSALLLNEIHLQICDMLITFYTNYNNTNIQPSTTNLAFPEMGCKAVVIEAWEYVVQAAPYCARHSSTRRPISQFLRSLTKVECSVLRRLVEEPILSYFQRHAISLAVRGVDVVILDNCPSHRVHSLALWLRAVGIEVLFLPRYWPQWNPIEVSDICFVVFIFVSLHR